MATTAPAYYFVIVGLLPCILTLCDPQSSRGLSVIAD